MSRRAAPAGLAPATQPASAERSPTRAGADARRSGVDELTAGNVAEAIRVLRSELAAAPSQAACHHNLALALRIHGDLEEAIEHARAACELRPSAASLALAASIEALAGRSAGGLLERALVLDPHHAPSLYQSGVHAAQRGERARALELLEAVSRLPLPPVAAARVRGQIHDLEGAKPLASASSCRTALFSEVLVPQVLVSQVPVSQVPVSQAELGSAPAPRPASIAAAPRPRLGRAIDVAEARRLVGTAKQIVALTGAGISTASGLLTRKQLWLEHDRDACVTAAGFARDPLPLWETVRAFLGTEPPRPNAAHEALARFERLAGVVTQNVDELHQAAGTPAPVIELHGSLMRARCHACGERSATPTRDLVCAELPPRCRCGGALRPDVVLFGEWVDRRLLDRALALRCDVMLVIGTAADVSPAADLAILAAEGGATVIEMKHHPSRLHHHIGTLHLAGAAADRLPEVLA